MQNATYHKLPTPIAPIKRLIGITGFLSLFALAMLSGCGGGAESQSKPPANDNEAPIFTGSLKSDDIKAFKKELWEKVSPASVCGRCHRSDADLANRQTPYFVDWLDVNFAYDVVVGGKLVDLVNPASSLLVQRVASGHQCWLGTTDQCVTAMTNYITAWANNSKKGTTLDEFQIELPPRIEPPGTSKFFPIETPTGYNASNLHALVTQRCAGCHVSSAANAQSPFFAEPNADASYQAIKNVINLNDPAASRTYQRLLAEHNCWSTCSGPAGNAAEMLAAIQEFADALPPPTGYDTDNGAVSMALRMQEGNVAASHNRYESDQIALYEFKSGSINPNSNTIYDTSGVEPAINLTLMDNKYRWLSNWGIEFTHSRGALASVEDSRKLYNLIRLTGEYSVEAWVIPANVNQENATMIALSGGSTERNFALGQTMYNYDFYQRSSTPTIGADGDPKLMTDPDDEDLQATLQHVVVTYSRANGRRIYVNGKFTGDVDPEAAGDLLNWHSDFVLSLGNELSNNRFWDGILRMVAIHDRALNDDQIQQNYLAEVGQKYQVPFNVSKIIGDGVENSYVVFEVSQFDEFSYMFRNPRFINIDPANIGYVPPKLALRGMRIGMNNQIVTVGQAYTNVAIEDVSQGYSPKTGLILSTVDTILPIQNGVAGSSADEFFLTFDDFGTKHYVFTENDQLTPPPLPTVAPENKPSDIGIRTFDEINASMAEMTGIKDWPNVVDINKVYVTYRQQLPAVENIESFLSSHQMAIAQLAMSYCSERVIRDAAVAPGSPNRFFTDFNFELKASEAFLSDAQVKQVVDPLLLGMLNATDLTIAPVPDSNLETQPMVSTVRQEIDKLIKQGETFSYPPTTLPANPNTPRIAFTAAPCMSDLVPENNCNNVTRTRQIVKAACAAVLGSAVMLVQ